MTGVNYHAIITKTRQVSGEQFYIPRLFLLQLLKRRHSSIVNNKIPCSGTDQQRPLTVTVKALGVEHLQIKFNLSVAIAHARTFKAVLGPNGGVAQFR